MLFPNGEKPVVITLYKNVPFTNSYEHHFFKPDGFKINGDLLGVKYSGSMCDLLDNAKDENNKDKYPHTQYVDTFNFDYGNGLVTSVVLETTSNFTDANYMKINFVDGTNVLYFFITNTSILSSNSDSVTIRCSLELDVLASYDKELLKSLKDVPLQTERKHCQRFSIGNNKKFYCCDLSVNEDVTNNIKTNNIKDVKKPNVKIRSSKATSSAGLKGLNWYYAMYKSYVSRVHNDNSPFMYPLIIKNVTSPFACLTFPDVDVLQIQISNETLITTFYRDAFLRGLALQDNCYSMKIMPYPPFTSLNTITNLTKDNTFSVTESNGIRTGKLVIDSANLISKVESNDDDGHIIYSYRAYFGNNILYYSTERTPTDGIFKGYGYGLALEEQVDTTYYTTNMTNLPFSLVIDDEINTSLKSAKYEPKLQFYPCTKYLLKSQYAEGVEIHPELVACQQKIGDFITLNIWVSGYGGDSTISCYPVVDSEEINVSSYYHDINVGFISSPSYDIPVGSSALATFQQTQKQTFNAQTTSKIIGASISAISGLVSAGMGNAVGTALGLTGALAQASTTLMNYRAKYNDLHNTPETYSSLGSNIYHDVCVNNGLVPFLVTYKLTDAEEQQFLDYFYNYGYAVNRSCFFNSELGVPDYTDTNWVDTRLFTRNNFNYIKLGEDITNKIDSSVIPYIAKEKIGKIFMNGITLWTFFDKNIYDFSTIKDYLLKEKYENVEIIM